MKHQNIKNCLGKIHLSDFHAPIEIAAEVMALGNVVHVDLLMLNKGACWVWQFFVEIFCLVLTLCK